MKSFTRLFLTLMSAVIPLASTLAATITVTVGDNFYQAPGGGTTVTISSADALVFQYPTGFSSHPTMSDSSPAAWTTFQMNAGSRTKTFPANFFLPGTYPFHCTAHGGQTGTLVVQRTAATDDVRPTLALNLFPNPSKGPVTVQFTPKAGVDYKLRLSNVIGQEVRTIALKPELTEAGLPVDLRDLPTGMYFYSLVVDGKIVSSKRLVLQN